MGDKLNVNQIRITHLGITPRMGDKLNTVFKATAFTKGITPPHGGQTA